MVFFQPGSLSSRAHLGFSSLRTCLDKNIEESYHPQKTSRFPCASQELKISLFSPYFSKKTLSACISLSDHVLFSALHYPSLPKHQCPGASASSKAEQLCTDKLSKRCCWVEKHHRSPSGEEPSQSSPLAQTTFHVQLET